MNTIVIYQSKYGFTETYAKWLAGDLGAKLLPAGKVTPADLQQYETIVYGGGLYAGNVSGISLLTKNVDLLKGKNLYLFSVGSSDMTDQENIKAIRGAMQKSLPPALWETAHIYHLRGGLRYSRMGFLHRSMMKMLINMLRKKPESELQEGEKGMLETFGQDVNFTDRSSIAPLVADIMAQAGRSCSSVQ